MILCLLRCRYAYIKDYFSRNVSDLSAMPEKVGRRDVIFFFFVFFKVASFGIAQEVIGGADNCLITLLSLARRIITRRKRDLSMEAERGKKEMEGEGAGKKRNEALHLYRCLSRNEHKRLERTRGFALFTDFILTRRVLNKL